VGVADGSDAQKKPENPDLEKRGCTKDKGRIAQLNHGSIQTKKGQPFKERKKKPNAIDKRECCRVEKGKILKGGGLVSPGKTFKISRR